MINKIHFTSAVWETLTGIEVVKPTAWRFEDFDKNWFQTPITINRFFELCDDSTCFSNLMSRADMIRNAKLRISTDIMKFN